MVALLVSIRLDFEGIVRLLSKLWCMCLVSCNSDGLSAKCCPQGGIVRVGYWIVECDVHTFVMCSVLQSGTQS